VDNAIYVPAVLSYTLYRKFFYPRTGECPLIKRVDALPGQMQQLAQQLFQYQSFSGVIVRCRPEDIPYYGMALTLMLKNFPLPVVLFSQEEQGKEADFWASISGAGVFALEKNNLYLACRMTWQSGELTSPHYPPVGTGKTLFVERLPKREQDPCFLCAALNDKAVLFRPGENPEERGDLSQAEGVVVALAGEQDLGWLFREQMPLLEQLHRKNIPVVVTGLPQIITDCQLRRQILRSGIISAGDMTPEAALVKLMWTLVRTRSKKGVQLYFGLNFGGEITLPDCGIDKLL
jgi:L-asparaginase